MVLRFNISVDNKYNKQNLWYFISVVINFFFFCTITERHNEVVLLIKSTTQPCNQNKTKEEKETFKFDMFTRIYIWQTHTQYLRIQLLMAILMYRDGGSIFRIRNTINDRISVCFSLIATSCVAWLGMVKRFMAFLLISESVGTLICYGIRQALRGGGTMIIW